MMIQTSRTYFVLAVLWLGACASVHTRLPIPNKALVQKEAGRQESQAFARYKNLRVRLDRVSGKILAANHELCKKTRADFGLLTHSQKSYPKHMRAGAKNWLGAGESPHVFVLRQNGPAAKAGIKLGDILLGPKHKPITERHKSLHTANRLHVRRAGVDMVYDIEPDTACDYPVRLKISGAINAYANSKSITVTSAMMDFAKTDDELALVIGHELAHNTQSHVPKAIWNSVVSGFAKRTTRPFEQEADYIGLYYTARAGYKTDKVDDFWRRLGVLFPKNIVRAKTHPLTPERLLMIRMTSQEIKQKRAEGKAILPNYTRPQSE